MHITPIAAQNLEKLNVARHALENEVALLVGCIERGEISLVGEQQKTDVATIRALLIAAQRAAQDLRETIATDLDETEH